MFKTPTEANAQGRRAPVCFDADALESDLARLRADGRVVQCCARLEAARILCAHAPDLFSPAAHSVVARYLADTETSRLAVSLREGNRVCVPPCDDFAFPPPRMPFLVAQESSASLVANALQDGNAQVTHTQERLDAFLHGLPESAWGTSLLCLLALPAACFLAGSTSAALIVHPAFDAYACYAGEAESDGDALFVAPLESGSTVVPLRVRSLWAHEAGHLAHGIALRSRGLSPFLAPDVDKETVGLLAELLCLCGADWEGMCAAVARGDVRTLSAIALWWQSSLRGGGAYVPAAWRVWNAARLGVVPDLFL